MRSSMTRCRFFRMEMRSAEVSGAKALRIVVDANPGISRERCAAYAALLAVPIAAFACGKSGIRIARNGALRVVRGVLVNFHILYLEFQWVS